MSEHAAIAALEAALEDLDEAREELAGMIRTLRAIDEDAPPGPVPSLAGVAEAAARRGRDDTDRLVADLRDQAAAGAGLLDAALLDELARDADRLP